jgi:hypothetical protein
MSPSGVQEAMSEGQLSIILYVFFYKAKSDRKNAKSEYTIDSKRPLPDDNNSSFFSRQNCYYSPRKWESSWRLCSFPWRYWPYRGLPRLRVTSRLLCSTSGFLVWESCWKVSRRHLRNEDVVVWRVQSSQKSPLWPAVDRCPLLAQITNYYSGVYSTVF